MIVTREQYITKLEENFAYSTNYKECADECKRMHGRLASRQILAVVKVFSDRIDELETKISYLEDRVSITENDVPNLV